NPRTMDPEAKRLLKVSLEKFNLAEPLIWNKRSGRLVGGHQRISILDKKQGYPATDYTLPVIVVDLDEKKEKRLNIWLNNPSAQGHFERDKFLSLLNTGTDTEIKL